MRVRVWVCLSVCCLIVCTLNVCVPAVPCMCIPVVLSMSLPLTQLCWHALYTLMYIQFDGMCVTERVQRMCISTGGVCLCIQTLAAAGHHLWLSPPSGLLWLQIVPLGSQGSGCQRWSSTRRGLQGWTNSSVCYINCYVWFSKAN